MPFSNKEYNLLIKNILPFVPAHGWSMQSLELAAKKSKIDPSKARLHFNGEVAEIVAAYSEYVDSSMLKEVKKSPLQDMKIRDRVTLCVIARLNIMNQHKEAAKKAAAFLAVPTHVPLGTSLVAKTVDKIWYACGDTATDFNYYTKRALLSGVYVATVTYWLTDNSVDFQKTQDFLGRRIDNVMCITKAKYKIKGFFEGLGWFK